MMLLLVGIFIWLWIPGLLVNRALGRWGWPAAPLLSLCCLPVFIALEWLGAPPCVAWTGGVALLAAWAWAAHRTAPTRTGGLPTRTLLVLAGLGVVWAVMICPPLLVFRAENLPIELWFDAHQRFGIIHALQRGFPPENPFLAGKPLRYYYFFAYPFSRLLPWAGGDLFLVWKVLLLHGAVFAPAGLFVLLRRWGLRSRVALWGVLLAFFFSSYEFWCFRTPQWNAGFGSVWAFMLHYRPDHQTGVVMTYSDQTLWEGFVYAPQNWMGAALVAVMAAALRRRRALGVALALAALTGANTFLALPAVAGLGLYLLLVRRPLAWRLGTWLLAGGLSMGSAAMVRLLPLALAWPALALALAGGLLTQLALRGPLGPIGRSRWTPPRVARGGLMALCVGIFVLFMLSNWRNSIKYLLCFGPAFVLFGWETLAGWRWPGPGRWLGRGRFFLWGYLAAHWGLTLLLLPQEKHYLGLDPMPLFYKLYDSIHLFNFYEKSGMFVRLAMVGFAAGWMAWGWERLRGRLSRAALMVVLLASSLSVAVQGICFLVPYNRAENALIPAYTATATLDDVLLTENFRANCFHMSASARVWYYSQWEERPLFCGSGLSSWAWQYVLPEDLPECDRRQALIPKFFDPSASDAFRLEMLRREGITLVHSFKPLRPLPGLKLLASHPEGGCLYRFQADAP